MTSDTALGFDLETLDGETVVIFRRSWLETDTFRHLESVVDRDGIRHLLLDLRDVKSLGAEPLAMLFQLKKKMNSIGGVIRIRRIPPGTRDLFRITKFDRLITIIDDEQDAPGER